MSCVIEVFPSNEDQMETTKDMKSLIDSKIKGLEQKVKRMDKLIGLKDLKSDFVLENKFFETVCKLRQYLYTVS